MMPEDPPVFSLKTAAGPLVALMPPKSWLLWTARLKPDGKIDKIPACGARTNDPSTWRTLDTVLAMLIAEPSAAGIGFIIVAGIITIDIDHCRDPVTGVLFPEVERELERMDSYAYITPSLTGIRIVGMNSIELPIPRGKTTLRMPSGLKIEIFVGPCNYYNTFTERMIPGYGTPRDISEQVLDYLAGLKGTTVPNDGHDRPSSEPQRGLPAIVAALKSIPNETQDWNFWCHIGMATWRSSGGSAAGLEAWRTWSARHQCHSDTNCDERWRHWFRSPPTRVGFGSLHHLAQQHNPLFAPPPDDYEEQASWYAPPPPGSGPQPHAESAPDFVATPLSNYLPFRLAPRRWLYGRELVLGFIAMLGGTGGVGKTAYTAVVGVSVALGRPLLVPKGCPTPPWLKVHKQGCVWFYNLEDPQDEMLRRLQAVVIHHRVDPADIADKIFVDSGRDRPLVVVVRTPKGALAISPIVPLMVAELKRRNIVLFIVDPFVACHHGEENRNDEMALVMALWSDVAHQADCAILPAHHLRKGGQSGDGDGFRGAGAIQESISFCGVVGDRSEGAR